MLTIETRSGDAITAGDVHLVPIARSVRLKLGSGALTWSRAIGVSARSAGSETLVPIRDRTRRLQLAILGAGLVGSLLLWLAGRRRSPR